MSEQQIKIAISAGELSGDEHAARVVSALRKILPKAEFKGMGGSKLRLAGVETIVDCETSGNVMGIKQVVLALPKILGALKTFKNFLSAWRPDVLIVVDYPDFHFRLIPFAKKLGIPVMYFIPPTVWAWREGRIKTLKKFADKLAVIYPFEEQFYLERGMSAAFYVGHPFSTYLPRSVGEEEKREIRVRLGLNPQRKTAALFPGSRRAEIQKNMGGVCEAFRILKSTHGDLQGVIALAPSLPESLLRENLPPDCQDLKISSESSIDILKAADGGVLKSGTSNLQAAFLGTPFVMTYRDSGFAKFLASLLVRVKEFSIVNIIRPGTIKEIIGTEPDPKEIAQELGRVIYDEPYRQNMLEAFSEIRRALNHEDSADAQSLGSTPYERAASLAASLLKKS